LGKIWLVKLRKYYLIITVLLISCCFLTNVLALKEKHVTRQWIRDSEFNDSPESWFISTEGDFRDVNASIYSGQGNFKINGEQKRFSLVADPPLVIDWMATDNPNFADRPDIYEITSQGCRVSHQFNDITAVQSPSVHWDQNISLPDDMSDYNIKSASIQAIVNATVDENLDRLEDYLTGDYARLNPNYIVDTYSIGDFIRFYVMVSDLKKDKVYEIAHFQTEQIGSSNPPGKDYLYDTYMISIPQETLLFYLGSVLSTDNHNFTITLGIRIHIEDNLSDYWDLDYFDELIIKYLNFSFTYEKKIDRFTSMSLNQIGESINGTNIEINNAQLDFRLKINDELPEGLSPNSEIKIYINNYEIDNIIKLSELSNIFQNFTLGATDIKSFILKDINISISITVFLADEFVLDRELIISVDDVYLIISYTIFIEESPQDYIFWIILTVLIIVIAILGSLSLRSYIILPRNIKKRNSVLLRTQKFKDAENIQGVLLIHNESGLPIYNKNYSELLKGNNTLFSGFIQAISVVGEELTLKKKVGSKGFRKDVIDGVHDVIELDFKHFQCLISDLEELRTVLILNSKASKRLKRQILNFGLSVYAKFSERIKNWDHDLVQFKEDIPIFLNNYFNLHYKEFFRLTITRSDLDKTKKELRLSRNDLKVLKEVFKISEDNELFKLFTLIEEIGQFDDESIIDSIEALIRNNILKPTEFIIQE